MSRWRVIVVALLIALPFVVLSGLGMLWLWEQGYALLSGWVMVASISAGYYLAYRWQKSQRLLKPVDWEVPPQWTDRDRQAWHLVEARANSLANIDVNRLTQFDFYSDTAKEMAEELARFYHPRATDPVGALTIPEILAAIELVAHDMGELVDRYLPGSHLLTVDNWRQAHQATKWYQTANNIYWIVSAVFNPINTGMRYAASRFGVGKPMQMLQQNLQLWFATAYVHRMGSYLIDVNSGRLRVGATRYRELVDSLKQDQGEVSDVSGDEESPPRQTGAGIGEVTLTVFGQVKAGKSSFINALLGEQQARVDVIPATSEVTRYELKNPAVPTKLAVQDTVGYGHAGPKADQLKATAEAAQKSDVLVLVLHARSPGRQADVEMVQALRAWFAARPDLKMPPTVAVLTHIDLLSPSLEWSPPYQWREPKRPKEQQIRQAVDAAREQLGGAIPVVVPVCTAAGKVYGIDEELLPTLTTLMDEARAVALVRCLKGEADMGKIRKVFDQLAEAGKQAMRIFFAPPPPTAPMR